MEENKLIVVYSRVSSAAQSLELQHSAARRYLESIGLTGNEGYVVELSDHDVSATKLKMKERPKLMELIRLIQEGKVKTVIGYKRDRFARSFYEAVDITRVFIKHGVEVIYTASNEPPFRNKLSLEAFYGMFGQMEGENIRSRTADARKQYPSNIWGYKRIKTDGKVSYSINMDKKELVTALFNDFAMVSNEEQFIDFILARRQRATNPERILRILTNPFYSAHYESKNGYQLLHHVEPMVNLDIFLATKSKIDEFIHHYNEKLQEVSNFFIITPLCGVCGHAMKHRKENPIDPGYFVCSAYHKRVAISVEEFNNLLNQTVLDHVKAISIHQAEKMITKRITVENKRLQQEQKKTVSEYLDASLWVSTLDSKEKSSLTKCLHTIKELKKKHNFICQDLQALQELKDDIKSVRLLTKQDVDITPRELQHLIELLVDGAFIFDSHVQVSLYLSAFEKDADIS